MLGESHIPLRNDTGNVLVHLYQYAHEELQYDDNRTAGESQTEDAVDQDPESYFGVVVDGFLGLGLAGGAVVVLEFLVGVLVEMD